RIVKSLNRKIELRNAYPAPTAAWPVVIKRVDADQTAFADSTVQRFNGSTISRMTFTFVILGVVTLAGAMAAMSLRNLVHCALCLVAAFGGLAGLFLQLGAQFVGLAQVLVYIGAVAILIVFAILLTRGSEPPQQPILAGRWLMGVAVAALT